MNEGVGMKKTLQAAFAMIFSPPLEALFDWIEFRQMMRRVRRDEVKRSQSIVNLPLT